MAENPDPPPDHNQTYEHLDEAYDDEDALTGEGGAGHEAARELDAELVVDQAELEEVGAGWDDPERISLLEGAIDDPDGTGAAPDYDQDAGADVDPVQGDRLPRTGAIDGTIAEGDDGLPGEDGADDDWEEGPDASLEILHTDMAGLDQLPDDMPGPDSAHW